MCGQHDVRRMIAVVPQPDAAAFGKLGYHPPGVTRRRQRMPCAWKETHQIPRQPKWARPADECAADSEPNDQKSAAREYPHSHVQRCLRVPGCCHARCDVERGKADGCDHSGAYVVCAGAHGSKRPRAVPPCRSPPSIDTSAGTRSAVTTPWRLVSSSITSKAAAMRSGLPTTIVVTGTCRPS